MFWGFPEDQTHTMITVHARKKNEKGKRVTRIEIRNMWKRTSVEGQTGRRAEGGTRALTAAELCANLMAELHGSSIWSSRPRGGEAGP